MRGLTFQGEREVRVEEVDDPAVERPTDAIVRVTMTGICGSDLHVFNAGEAFGRHCPRAKRTRPSAASPGGRGSTRLRRAEKGDGVPLRVDLSFGVRS